MRKSKCISTKNSRKKRAERTKKRQYLKKLLSRTFQKQWKSKHSQMHGIQHIQKGQMYKPKENAPKYNAGRPKDKDKEQQKTTTRQNGQKNSQ